MRFFFFYPQKIQSVSNYIPIISKSLTRIIHNSQNENFQTKMADFIQVGLNPNFELKKEKEN